MRLPHQTYHARTDLRIERSRRRVWMQKIIILILLGAVIAGVWGFSQSERKRLPEIAWQNDIGGAIRSSPVVYESILLVSSVNGNLYAIDRDSGQTVWRSMMVFPMRSSPAVANGIVVVGCDDHRIYALDIKTGKEIWRCETGGPIQSGAAVDNQSVYAGSDDGFVRSLDLRTGKRRWQVQFKTRCAICATPLVSNGTVFVPSLDGSMYALAADTGDLLWEFKTGAAIYSTPIVVTGTVCFGSDDHYIYGVDVRTGKKRWSIETSEVVRGSPTIFERASMPDCVVIACDDGAVRAIDANTGQLIWAHDEGDSIHCRPSFHDNAIAFGTTSGKLVLIDAEMGGLLRELSLDSKIEGGVVYLAYLCYVPTEDRGVFAVKIARP